MKHVIACIFALVASAAIAQDELPQTLFTNVHVFDGVNEARIENASVLVEGNLIKTVSADPIDAPDATVVDGGGRTLMPGLIDSHTHFYLSMGGGRIGMENSRWDLFPGDGCRGRAGVVRRRVHHRQGHGRNARRAAHCG